MYYRIRRADNRSAFKLKNVDFPMIRIHFFIERYYEYGREYSCSVLFYRKTTIFFSFLFFKYCKMILYVVHELYGHILL